MLIGTYYHTLEEGGRVSVPVSFRKQAKDWVVTRGLDGGLFLFPAENFEKKLHAIGDSHRFTQKASRDFIRLMTNSAQTVQADKSGRVNLPNYLIGFAGLRKNLVVVGSLEYAEIWERDVYHKYVDGLEQNAEMIAENIA